MRRLAGFRGLYLKVFLLLMFVSAFWVVGVGAEVVVVDWTKEDMYIGRMNWGNYLADCYRAGSYLTARAHGYKPRPRAQKAPRGAVPKRSIG